MKQTNQPTNPPFWKHSKPTTTTTTATAIACFKDHQNTQKKNIVRKINNHKKVEEEAQKFQQLESFCYVTCKASASSSHHLSSIPAEEEPQGLNSKQFYQKERTHTRTS
jgi:hypothetical protein